MSRLFFAPFGLFGGLLAGVVGKKIFEGLWGVIDKQGGSRPQADPATGSLRIRFSP